MNNDIDFPLGLFLWALSFEGDFFFGMVIVPS